MKILVNGVQIDYREAGSGLPVVLIHAFPLNQAMWDRQLEGFSSKFRVVSLDLRGFGGSDQLELQHTIDDMAEDVAELMTKLGVSKAVLVGLSMGGYVSMAFYRNHPERVRALVLADTRATADTEEARRRRFESAQLAEEHGAAAIAKELTPVLLGHTTLASKPDVVQRVHRIIESNSPRALAAAQRAMAARLDSTELLARADVPVLVVTGDEDSLSTPEDAERLCRGIRGATLQIVQRAGHLSSLEQPEAFNNVISPFLGFL